MMKVSRSLQVLLIACYFLALILTWSVTWRIPYRPNALFIDSVSLGLPFAFWLLCILLTKFVTKKSPGI
jgi:hypothetical protein